MSDISTTAKVTLAVNGEQAKKMIDDLKTGLDGARKELERLQKAKANPKDIEKARKNVRELEKQLREAQSATEGVRDVLQNLDKVSLRELEKTLKTLNKQFKDAKQGTEAYEILAERIKSVKEQIKDVRDELSHSENAWGRFLEWADGIWPVFDMSSRIGGSAISKLRELTEEFATMDQEMANVRKFTGMTEEEVKSLNDEFKKIDTRSSREELNRLAQEAGRLGKTSEEDILGFVRAADKINVALDDLGEGATLRLSKITGIFGDEEKYGTEQSLLKVGSVINDLSQNCSASAPYIAEFTSRLGGIGAQAKMTSQQIMAYAAVMDANQQQVEASSTALSQIIVRLYQDPAKYAKVAGMDVKKFSDLVKTDMNAALIEFLDTLNKAGGMDVLSPMFKDMGETGANAIKSLSVLASKIDQVKTQQEVANESFKKGTSVGEEFAVQNNTIQASLDKAQKEVAELRVEMGERLMPIMTHVLNSQSAIIRICMEAPKYISENKATITTLVAAIGLWTAALNANIISSKIRMAIMKAYNVLAATTRTLTLALSVAYNTLTGNITMATAATKLMNGAMKASIFGVIATAIALVIAKMIDYREKVTEAAKAQRQMREEQEKWRKGLTDIDRQSAEYAQKEKARLDSLYKAATDQTKSQKERINAVNELKKQYPEYFNKLSTECIMLGQAKKQYDDLTTSIIKAANARAANDKIAELGSEKLDHEMSEDKINEDIRKKTARRDNVQSTFDQASAMADKWKTREIDFKEYNRQVLIRNTAMVELRELNEEIAALIKKRNEDRDKIREISSAQSDLSRKYGVDIDAAIAGSNDNNTETPQASGYTSTVLSEKERKKQEREAKAAAAKEKAEFKKGLDDIKGMRAKAETEAMADRSAGLINYSEYIERMLEAEVKYYDDASEHYKKYGLKEDEDHLTLLKKKQEADDKYCRERVALNKEAIERIATIEERDIEARHRALENPTLSDDLAYKEELLTLRYNKLMDLQKLLKESNLQGSKEWEEYEMQLQDLLHADQTEKQKLFMEKVAEFQKKFDKMSVAEKYKLEYDALETLYKNKKISEEQYRKWLKGLQEQEKKELPGQSSSNSNEMNAQAAMARYAKQKKELNEAKNRGQIDEKEYEIRLRRIGGDLRDNLIEPLKNAKSEWVSLMTTMIDSWMDFADAIKGNNSKPLESLQKGIEATAAVMSASFAMATQFIEADLKIQTAAIEKRYDKEIKLAEGNSYRVAKLEKEKEDEIAKRKNEANRKMFAMQVVQAVAQTATNALNAYGSAAAIPVVGHILAPIAAAMAVAAGAVQIAAIKKQQQASEAQGYSKGGFTKKGAVDEPAGVVHAGEWVASQKLLANPVARPLIEALDYAQRTNTIGQLRAEDVSRSITASETVSRIADGSPSAAVVASVLSSNADVIDRLTQRLEEPFVTINTVTGDAGSKKAQDDYLKLMRNKAPKSRKNANIY